jgi:hypothetical protein
MAEEEKCVVGWIAGAAPHEFQLVALTYSGGWYRLALPRSASASAAAQAGVGGTAGATGGSVRSAGTTRQARAAPGRADKGKGKAGAPEDKEKESRECVLLEFRRFGSWDGWT